MAKDEEIKEQIEEGELRRIRAENTYTESLKKIKELAPFGSVELARRIGLGDNSKGNITNKLKEYNGKFNGFLRADNFLALLDLCGAEIFFPDEEKPINDYSENEDNSKLIRALERVISEQERTIRIYERQLGIKS